MTKKESFFRNNALTMALGLLFLGSVIGQIIAGHHVHDEDARLAGEAAMSLGEYLRSGHFVEAIFENWESEFLQIAVFVVLTKYLRQKGSSESKKLDGHDEVDDDPRDHQKDPGAPWPVKRGGALLWLYERSLSLSLVVLFLVSFVLHGMGGAASHNEENRRHGQPQLTTSEYMQTSQFWFESFQNWQSEFLSMGVLIVLSIYLRERGSPQSKPVAAPHHQTGE